MQHTPPSRPLGGQTAKQNSFSRNILITSHQSSLISSRLQSPLSLRESNIVNQSRLSLRESSTLTPKTLHLKLQTLNHQASQAGQPPGQMPEFTTREMIATSEQPPGNEDNEARAEDKEMKPIIKNIQQTRPGFTLVELLVAIAIIGILMGIAIPAIMRSVISARQTAQKVELTAISQAVEAYLNKYGDYPPDGSSQAVLARHMRRVFPRMAEPDITLLNILTDDSDVSDTFSGTFSQVAMDRGEALVFFLGGFSSDIQHPLTGAGGPLEFKGFVDTDVLDLANYQYNATRENALFDFDPQRLMMGRDTETSPMVSRDELEMATQSLCFLLVVELTCCPLIER